MGPVSERPVCLSETYPVLYLYKVTLLFSTVVFSLWAFSHSWKTPLKKIVVLERSSNLPVLGPPRYSGETSSPLGEDLLISRNSTILYLILKKEDIFSHSAIREQLSSFFPLFFFPHFYLKCLLFLPIICFFPFALWQTQRGSFCS